MKALFLASALLALAACGAETTIYADVSGSVDFDPVPASFVGMTFEVKLQDVSVADAAAIELASQQIMDIRSMPVEFSLPYLTSAVSERNTYTVSARAYTMVEGERQLQYITTRQFPVLTEGWSNEAQVVVEQVNN